MAIHTKPKMNWMAGAVAGLVAGLAYAILYSYIAYNALSGTPAATFAGGEYLKGYFEDLLAFSLQHGLILGLILGLLLGLLFVIVDKKIPVLGAKWKWMIFSVLMWIFGYLSLYRPPPPIPPHGSIFFAYYSPDFFAQMHLGFLVASIVYGLVYGLIFGLLVKLVRVVVKA